MASVDVNVEEAYADNSVAGDAIDLALTENVEGIEDANGNGNGHVEPENEAVEKLYFVRLPRPFLDDSLLKKLQADFQAHVAEIKAINTRLVVKRDVLKELRKQMTQARSLKDTSQPEFEEKLTRLKQLRDLHSDIKSQIIAIKSNTKGLECRTEAELDAKIVELEDKIRYGGIPLREEKMVVNDISKLRSQRDKIKEFESNKSSLGDLEAELKKIKASMDEMDGEFGIIKGERAEATTMMNTFWIQLKAAEAEAAKVEEEQKEAIERKNEALETLEAARQEVDGSMVDYRDNRKFSLNVRDLVAAGLIQEAQELCASNMEEWITKFTKDSVFRSEYNKIWAEQRRFAVSELLPESSTAAMAAAKQTGAASGGKGGAKGAPAEKLVARGAEKAKELIASLMMQVSAEAARVKSNAPRLNFDDEEEQEPEVVVPKAAAAAAASASVKPAALVKLLSKPAAKASEVFSHKVEIPVIEDVAFVPPAARAEAEPVSKEQIREEQKLRAQEAELRKKRRQETSDKKRTKAIELSKRSEEEERALKAAAKAQQAKPATDVVEPVVAEQEEEEEPAVVVRETAATQSYRKPSPSLNASALRPAAAALNRPASKGSLLKKLKKFYLQNQTSIIVMALVLLVLLILLAASFY